MGIGGWTYEPWRETFYPAGLPHAQELAFASRRLSTIEVNGTFYSTFRPATFAKWRDATPDEFVFSLKAPRFAVNRKVLSTAGASIARFVESGIGELGSKLGPILWQLAPTKTFDAEDLAAFFELLPREIGGRPQRHALEVRHPTFASREYVALARSHGVATVFADSDEFPSFADITADFVYARLMRSKAELETGYARDALDAWAEVAEAWRAGKTPADLPHVAEVRPGARTRRDVFVYFINGAKERAPSAASALIHRLA